MWDMEFATVIYALAAFLIAAFLKGITGLGFSTICLGLLATFVDIKTAIPLVIIASLASNLLVMVEAGRFLEVLRRFWMVYASALPGLALGLWLLGSVESAVARICLGVVLLGYGLWGLWARPQSELTLPAGPAQVLAAPAGFATGIVNGLTGSQVMPVLPYFLALRLEPDVLVQAINTSFTASSLVMLAGLGQIGLLTWEKLGVSAAGIAPVALGIWLGGKIRQRLSEARFRRLVLLLLVGLGLNLTLTLGG